MKFDYELVGKIGSMALVDKVGNDMDYNTIARVSRCLTPEMIWVTSGAVEIGRLDYIRRTGEPLSGDKSDNKTDYAAQGQAILMQTYRQYIDSNYSVRQILIEHQHFNDELKREHLMNTLMRCKEQKAIAIVNYNDAVSSEENMKWELEDLKSTTIEPVSGIDNDETASEIACLVKARRLLILTNVEGIYTNPKDSTTLIREIAGKDINELLDNISECQLNCNGSSREGANGASAKLEYIKKPVTIGTEVIIANSKYSINEILTGLSPSTIIRVR